MSAVPVIWLLEASAKMFHFNFSPWLLYLEFIFQVLHCSDGVDVYHDRLGRRHPFICVQLIKTSIHTADEQRDIARVSGNFSVCDSKPCLRPYFHEMIFPYIPSFLAKESCRWLLFHGTKWLDLEFREWGEYLREWEQRQVRVGLYRGLGREQTGWGHCSVCPLAQFSHKTMSISIKRRDEFYKEICGTRGSLQYWFGGQMIEWEGHVVTYLGQHDWMCGIMPSGIISYFSID